jgi:hypothetical protein
MPWWVWFIIAWLGLGTIGAIMKQRSGQMNPYYSDGCRRPFLDRAFRLDGTRNRIIPRRGDGEIEDLEHLYTDHCHHDHESPRTQR